MVPGYVMEDDDVIKTFFRIFWKKFQGMLRPARRIQRKKPFEKILSFDKVIQKMIFRTKGPPLVLFEF